MSSYSVPWYQRFVTRLHIDRKNVFLSLERKNVGGELLFE